MKRKRPFNWLTTLNRLVKNPKISEKRLSRLRNRAARWPTCACGQLCKKLPRNAIGSPVDFSTKDMGINFFFFVNDRQWPKALSTFHAIERRTAELLRKGEK